MTGSAPFLPVPTIAGSLKLDSAGRFTIAGGFLAPQAALASYPATVDGQPSPGRYSLGSFDGSALGIIGAWLAWKPIEQLRFGVGVLGLVGQFETTVTFSTCPAVNLACNLEQPSFDANAQIKVSPIVRSDGQRGRHLGSVSQRPFRRQRAGADVHQRPGAASDPAP